MKILMTLMGLDIGGAETHVVELARELSRQGHEILIASNGGAYVPELEAAGIRHAEIPMHQRSAASMARSLRLLRQLILREQPDLVHAHARIPAFLCGILQKTMHFPFITSAHWVFTVTPLLRLMTNWGDRTVAVSQDIKAYLMENYQVPEDQIHVTINGIDTDTFHPHGSCPELKAQLGLGNGPVIGLVSRLDESRALAARHLISIAPALAERFPQAEILIVGGGDQEAVLMQAAAAANQAAGREVVHMTGPRTDIAQLVSLCSVFVGVSRAALEAMSAAKPVILAGNEGYMGILTPPLLEAAQESNFCCRGSAMVTDAALLADLTALLTMPETQRQELGGFGRQVIETQYSVRRMAQDYLRAYDALLHPQKPITAVISGYYGYSNLGDDAIMWAIHRQLSGLERPVRLVVLSRRPRETARKYGLQAVNRFSLRGVYRAIRKSDVLISGGGSLLQDRTSTRSVRYYLWVIRLAQHLGKPVFLYANGIGPLSRPSNRQRVCRTLERCDCITLRDGDSLEELRALGLTRQDILVTGDPAFSLTPMPQPQARQYLTALGIPPGESLVGISVRRAVGMDRAAAEFAALGDRICRELHKTVVFVVMQEPEDAALSHRIQQLMQTPSYCIQTPNQPEAMLGIIGCMDAMISLRLHTVIFSARERVPVVGCVYDPKVQAFLKLLDMPSCGRPEEMTADGAFEALKQLLTQPLDPLDQRVRTLEADAEANITAFRQLLQKRGLLP